MIEVLEWPLLKNLGPPPIDLRCSSSAVGTPNTSSTCSVVRSLLGLGVMVFGSVLRVDFAIRECGAAIDRKQGLFLLRNGITD